MKECRGEVKFSEIAVKQTAALDFDRTLGDVKASMARFFAVAEIFGIDPEEVAAEQQKVESDGGSFSPLKFVRAELNAKDMSRFVTRFTTLDGPSILYPDSMPFLQRLQRHAMPFHVLTWGVDPDWQRLKIAASGYKGGLTVMDHSDKGLEIAGWKDGSRYNLSDPDDRIIYLADSVALVDDKAIAFKSLAPDNEGFLLQRGETLLPSQRDETPENVSVIKSLDDLSVVKGKLVKR